MPRITESIEQVTKMAQAILGGEKTNKVGIYIKLDQPVVEWFKALGPGYQGRINEVLRRFICAVGGEDISSERTIPRVEKAQELYEKYYEQCFWYMKRNLIVTNKEVPQIIKGLKTYGGHSGYLEAAKLCL